MSKSKQKAVALKYNAERDEAPIVIASGYGSVAEKIIDIAEQKGIPVFRDDSAASLLCMLEVGNSVPPELYEVIAAVYCQLLQVSSEIKGNSSGQPQKQRRKSLSERAKRLNSRRPVTSTVVRNNQSPQNTEESQPPKNEETES
jgi:FlhB-like protein